ncbi:MAG: tetratricopeptide repeat protein [Acidobacteriota bacterium]
MLLKLLIAAAIAAPLFSQPAGAPPPELARRYANLAAAEPANADARANYGVLLYFQGEYAKAAAELRQALKLRPGLWKIQALLGLAEKRLGRLAQARADLEKAFAQLQEEKLRVETGMELIEIYYGSGELEKAAGAANALRRLRPADPDILYVAHRIYSELADETMLSLSMAAPKSARMHQAMAHELARQGNSDGAIVHYREALKLDPNVPGAHFELAEMLNGASGSAGELEAEREYKAALQANPFDAKSACRLGEIAAKRSETQAAYTHYARAVELAPDDLDANLGLARALIAMKQPEKAEPLLKRAVKIDPTHAIAHYRLAALYRSSGRLEEARVELAEFQKYKEMKERLKQIYGEMRLKPAGEERPDE